MNALDRRDEAAASIDLVRALETSDRFRRDSRWGAILHPGKISFREVSATDSLHILIDGVDVSAHVDEVSPLKLRADGSSRYSWFPVVAHSLVGLAAGFSRRVRGQHGTHRCNLRCEVEWVEDEAGADSAGPD